MLLSGLAVEPGAAQEINPAPQCDACSIRLDTVASLGDKDGPGTIPNGGTIARSPDGLYYVMSTEAQVIQVFRPDGRLVHELGGRGQGPGELLFPVAMHVDDEGRLFVPDARQQRLTVFDREFRVERTERIDAGLMPQFTLFTIPGDSIIMTGHSASPDLFGLPVHVLSPGGQRVRSFGERDGPVVARDPYRTQRALARAGLGMVWVGSRYDEYRIELWTLAGRKVGEYHADVDWFDPIEEDPAYPSPPEAHLHSIREDEDGLLWLLFSVPDPRWREASVRDPGAPHGWRTVHEEYWADTVVDVFDPSRQRLLARSRYPATLGKLFGSRGAYSSVKEVDVEEGLLQIHVLRLHLDGWER